MSFWANCLPELTKSNGRWEASPSPSHLDTSIILVQMFPAILYWDGTFIILTIFSYDTEYNNHDSYLSVRYSSTKAAVKCHIPATDQNNFFTNYNFLCVICIAYFREEGSKSVHFNYFLNKSCVIYPITTKYKEIIWGLVFIVFTKHKMSSINITLKIRFFSIYWGKSGRSRNLK